MERLVLSKNKVWLTLTLTICSLSLFSQTGTTFWATAPYSTPSHDGNHTIHVVVSSLASPATVTLSIPANPSFTPITISLAANSTDYFDFNALMLTQVEMSEWDQTTNKGILIQSTDKITSYLEVFSTYNTDIFALKGRNALGTDFYTPFETGWGNHDFACVATNTSCVQAYSHAEIVATENNTTVIITPSVDVYKSPTGVHPAGVPYPVTLNKGQTFTVRANDITTTAQLAGTHITSDKPIAVTIDDDSMQIGGAYDIVGDQLTPVSVEGSQYIAMKGYLTDEYVYGVASQNTTKISVNGVMRAKTYNKGDTIIVKLVGNTTVIQSDNKQPFNMFHVSGNANEAGGALLPPTDQCTGSMQVGFNFGHADLGNFLYLNLMVRTGAETNFLVDGVAVAWLTPASFTVVPGTSWSVARFTLTNTELAKGNHLISNTKDLFHMGYINYTGPGAMYGYFSDFENMVVSVVAIKSNTDTVVACTGEPLQLRVDGGVNYLWSGKNVATNADASGYLSSKTIYNPMVLGTIPTGDYLYTVSVTSACNGPAVTKTVKIKVVQSPSPQTKTVNICESSVGSSCVSNINLTSYKTLMTNSWPTGAVTEWQKDSYNQMVTLDNYDGIRVVNYGTQNARTFNMAFPNPIPTSSVNPSATVLKFEVGGGSSGTLTLNSQANYPFDLNNGAIFQLKVMNTVYSSWSATAFRSVTMKLKNNTDSAIVTTSLSKYDKWELLTFDFSALPKKVYNTMIITLNGKDYEQDVFYVDDIQKQFNYQKTTITTPTATNICSPEKIYALVEDANGCSANSVLSPVIAGGTFAVGNPAITLCQTGTKVGEATGVNFTAYTTNITNSVAGLSIVEWDKTFTNYDSVYENFDNITGKLTWNTPSLIAASGTAPLKIVNTLNNPKSPIQNTSSKVASVYYGQGNGYSVSTDLVNSIDLSQGWVFNVMASYWTGQWGNGSSTQSVTMTLSGSSGTVSVGPINIHHTSSNNQGTTDSNHIWNNVVFDFTSFKTQKGFDRITINYNTSNWATDSFYFDNFHRTMQPFLDKTTPPNQTVQNGDKVYAIVKDASGCLVKSTITFTVKDCGPPAIDQTDTMCEATIGSGNVTAINITNYNNAIKGNVAANTVTWYSNATLTTLVATPTNVTVTNGLKYYALVKDPGNGKQDTATLKFIIKSLPNIVFPTIAAVCEGSSTFTITGTTPSGGTWSGGTYITATGVFDPTKATVGAANTVTYSITVNGCSSTKNATVTVNANPNPTLVTAAKDLLYCGTAGVPVTVSNNIGASYVWTKNGTGISGTTNTQAALTSGTYAVTATVNGCSKSVTNIVVSGHDIPEYTITGGGKYCDDTVTIPGVTIALTKGDMPWNVYYTNGTSKWNKTAVATATYAVPTANLKPGTYVLDSLTNAYCKAVVKATLNTVLTEVKRPSTTVTTTDFSYCGTVSDVTLTVTPFTPTSYEWKRGATVVGTNSNSYANATVGTYSVTLTNDICKSSINNIIVTQYNKPTYAFSGGGTFCQGKTVSPILIAFTGAQPWTVTYRIDGTAYPVTVNATPYTVTQLIAGNYDISSITDNNTCVGDINATATGSASITINPKPTVKFNYVDSICQTTPTINVTSKVSPTIGGTGVYSGAGINATTGIFTHTGPNSYNLMYTFTDVNGCIDSAKRTVKVNENPITTISPDPATVCVSTNLILDGNPTKGTIPYTHLWTDASSITTTSKTAKTITIKTITPNTYNLVYTVTDKNGCVGTDNISVKVNGMPTIVATALPTAVCNGATTTISATGATSYVWNPTTVGLITPATSTSFYVTGTDANGCSNTATTAIIVNALPTIVATASATPICIGKPTTISATGATTYVWNPTTVGIVNPTTSTTYNVTGTDGNGCKATSNVAVTVNQLPSIVATANPTSICIGTLSTITASGGTSYVWDNTLGTGASKSVSLSTTITYTVTGTDVNTCINSTTVKVTVNNLPSITASPLASICNGFGTTIIANGGTSYSWNNTVGTASQTVSPTITTTYSVTGTDINNCKNTASTVITVNAIPTVLISLPTLNTSTGNYCISNATPIAITTNPSSVGTVLVAGTGVAGTTPNYTFTPSNAGIGGPYTLTFNYTDANGCKNSTTTTASVYALPTVAWAAANPTLVCSDGAIATITVNANPAGGTGVFGAITGLTELTETTASFNPVSAGVGLKTLNYTYTDTKGCISSTPASTITVFDTPEPTVQNISRMSTPAPLAVGAFMFNVSSQSLSNVTWYNSGKTTILGSGNIYDLKPDIPLVGTSPDSLVAGTYNYVYTQTVNGCESQPIVAKATITNCPSKAPIASTQPIKCTAATLSSTVCATAQGTSVLVWFSSSIASTSGANLGSGTCYTVSVTAPQTYTYYVSEYNAANTCFGPTTPVTLTINPLPTITASTGTSPICTSFSSSITALGANTYAWSNGINTGTQTVSPTAPTISVTATYSVTGTDANGCTNTASTKVIVNPSPTITASALPTAVCNGFGSTITANGAGTGSYIWSNLAITANQTLSPSATTTYLVTGTDANGCINTATTKIVVNQIPTVNLTLPTLNTSTGNYCVNSTALPISISPNTGTISVTGNGVTGTSPSYSFNPATALAGGPYTITFNYTDTYGCKNSTTTTASVYALPTVVWSATNPTLVCSDGALATISVNVNPTGGTGTFGALTGLSKVNETTATLDPVTASSGNKTISYSYTDLNGCDNAPANTSINVFDTPEPTALSISRMSTPVPLNAGTFIFDVTGQSLSNVKWYNSTKTTVLGSGNTYDLKADIPLMGTSPDSLVAGSYNYVYTQTINGCESQAIVAKGSISKCPAQAPVANIIANPCTAASLTTSVSATAQGAGTLVWFSTAVTGTGSIKFGSGNSYSVSVTSPANYLYYVAEWNAANSCFGPTTSVGFTINPLPTITATASVSPICTGFNSDLTAIGANTYAWSNSINTGTQTVSPTAPTIQTSNNYTVTGTDANGCKNTASVTVVVNPSPTITATAPAAICYGFGSTISGSGGTSYSWDNTLGLGASKTVSPSITTTYNVTGTDVNGCLNTASTVITVNGTPTISLTAPTLNTTTGNYCINAPALTLNTTQLPAGGIVSLSGTGVSGTTFTPATAGAGTYTITFNYTDLNGCKNSTTTSATVFALPTVVWAAANPTLVCIDGNAVNIDVTTTPTGGTGTFTAISGLNKTNENTASFNPKTAGGAGVKALNYSYTDLNGCTQAAVPSSIEVFDTPEPTVQSISTMSTPIPSSFCFDVSSQGLTFVKWYPDPKTIVVGTGNSYCPVITHTGTSPDSLIAGTYNYLYSQTINGCESQTIAATAIVSNCPAKAPIAGVDPKPCTKANLSTVISATAQGSGSLVWFSTSSTKTVGLATGTTFIVTTNSGSTNIVYVAEWDNTKACFGPSTPVTLTVNPLPTPTISATPSLVCYTSGIQTLNVSHTTGAVLKGTGAISYNTFDPTLGGKIDGTYKLTYIVTDANNCVDSATVNMTVTYADAPVEDAKQPYLLLDIPNSGTTKPEVCATKGAGSGLGIEWAIDAAFSSPIAGATGLCYDTKEMNVITNKAYYVRQTENGCKSDAIASHITIVDCPWNAPSKVNVAKCENDATLTSTVLSASTTEPTPSWQWYSDDKFLSPIAGATASTYNPDGNIPGSTDYYVRFEQTETSSGKTCWSPATKVSRTVYQKPALSIVPIKDSVCYNSGQQTLTLTPAGGILTGTGAVSPNKFDPTTAGKIDGQYTLTYVYSDANSCSNTTTHVMTVTYANALVEDVKIPYLLIPVQAGTTIPYVCAKQGAIAGSGLRIEWSNDSLFTASIAGATGLCYNTNIKLVTSNQAFYVRQTENGCKSDAVAAHLTIVDCPWAAPSIGNVAKCENDPAVLTTNLTASTTETSPSWQWYKDALVSLPISGATASTYNPGGNTAGSTDYYVRFSQTEPSSGVECWSQPTKVTRKVNAKPIIAITNTTTHLCVDNAPITITTSSNATGTGIFTESYLTNVNNSYADFDPRKAGIGIDSIHYTFTDGNGCISTTSQAITVDSSAPPTVKPLFQDMVHNPVPQLIATGTSLKWYSILPIKNSIGSGTPFLDASIAETDIVNYKDYWVTQTLNGCESQPSHTQMLVNACPVPMPNVDKNGFKRCSYDNSPAISASSGTTWPLPESANHGYYWYTSQLGTSETFKGTTFNPSVSGQVGVQTYYVAEYDSLYTCFGPRQKVTFTIVPVAKPDVVAVDPICFSESNKTFTVNTPVALNKYVWYGTADTLAGKLTMGISFTPTEKTVGTHNYWATRIDENNCRSVVTPISMEIKPKPGLPTLADDESCDIIENIKTLTATGDASSVFEWYINDSLHYKATNPTLTPIITSTTTYYVRQNLNSCRGWFAPVIYTIKPRPTAPIVLNKAICSYNDIPSFDVTATGIVNWYGQNQTLIGNDNPYKPNSKTSSDYFITQTIKGCESQQTKIHFEVHPAVSKPTVTDHTRKCENIGAPSITITVGTNIKWYGTNDTTIIPVRTGGNSYNFISKPYGEYHIYVTQTDGFKCQSEPLDAVAFVDSVPAKPLINEQSVSICAYDVIPTFTSTNNNAIQWYVNGIASIAGSSILLNSAQIKEGDTKNFTIKVTTPAPGSCVSVFSDAVSLTRKITPAIPTFTTKDVCTDDDNQIIFRKKTGLFTISDVPATHYWTTDSILDIPASYNSSTGDKTFSIYQTVNGCESKATTGKFLVRSRPTPQIIGRDRLCENSLAVPYSIAVKNPTSSFNWSITGGRTLYKTSESIQGYTRNVDYIETGIDTLTVFEDNGYCIGKGILPVKVAPAPTADFRWDIPGGLSKVYFVNTSSQTNLTDGKYSEPIDLKSFHWNFGRENERKDSIQSFSSYDNNDEIKIKYNYGNHEAKLVAINSFGCKDSITKKFFVDLAEGLYFANSFVPTSKSEGLNKFTPVGFNIDSYELWIYDIWGNLLWYSNKLINGSPAESWDGMINGEVLKLDTYIWKCEATFKDGTEYGDKHGKKYSKFGNVLLLE